MIGQRFNRLVVVSVAPSTGKRRGLVNVRCDCGTTKVVGASDVRNGHIKSCGCHRSERAIAMNTKHGQAQRGKISREWLTWRAMHTRCENPKHKSYADYGGRGITVCERWNSFENFLSDMGERPSGKTLERIDNSGNYEPDNCKWATAKEQANNRRLPFSRKQSEQAPNDHVTPLA